ncbi:MAG: TIM barrel protein [Hoeflea sp.]|uniref:2-oxo-tetronate isomerase n=1 Tax=Hoeflea sp. TaxID=1940281 RepID=UPI001D8F9881|nr:2-oxo-tetronate isomerase [Hoeflea sp.]MBU4529918.1 TIM barrel protein [Alphaproteobacteria bacterium]MBU4547061.1 TIM barrel protein [Alphaproteobacteria bacterium]MBU4548674.1 TIM barrel protein [Alphaproteobacteria bacterium]MBV1722411.1 TIM barrel protein [Hoeflea sp.]MBV1762433.1 TIM barrel protein [Hoeflea sp.]
MPRFAANLSMMFTEHAFLDRFEAAAEAGFGAVEFLFPYDYPAQEIALRLTAASVEQVLFNLPPGDWAKGERGLAALPERKAEFQQSVRSALEYATVIGASRLHMMAGLADPGSQRHRAAYRDSLAFAADAAAEQGIDVLIEPLNGRDMPGYFLRNFDDAADLIADLGRENIKLQFDIYHRQILHGDVIRGLESLLPVIGHVQIASVPHRNEPGSGELDDFRILEVLDELGYKGFVGCEYRPRGATLDSLAWMTKAGSG